MAKHRPSNNSPFKRFQNLIRGLVAVPKKEIEAEEARWRADCYNLRSADDHADLIVRREQRGGAAVRDLRG